MATVGKIVIGVSSTEEVTSWANELIETAEKLKNLASNPPVIEVTATPMRCGSDAT